MPKSYFIKTYGCQMNKNDSEVLAGILGKEELEKREAEIEELNLKIKERKLVFSGEVYIRR